MKTRYIFSMGKLQKRDNSLLFKNKKEQFYIPIKGIRDIYFLNEVSLNTRLLNFISKHKIVLHFFNFYGYYSGTYYPKRYLRSGNLTIEQSLAYVNKRLIIAKAIVQGIANNVYDVIYHYYRHGKSNLKELLDWLKNEVPNLIDVAKNINQIMFIEGSIWSRFYNSFKHFLPEDFLLNKRVKRPPDNPMNALIGFGNSILYTKTITALYHTQLNQSISFLHEPSEARFSLSLDLSESFKPIIVFRAIFNLVNTKQLQVQKHFRDDVNYSLLNDDGKKIFISELEKRLNEKFYHPKLKKYVTYQTAIKYDGYKLIKFIIEDAEFKPFRLKDKV